MRSCSILFMLLVLHNSLFSQEAKKEVVNINKAYYEQSSVAMKIVNKTYKDNSDKVVSESQLEVYKMPGKFLFRSSASESMSNGDYKINLDNKKKLIIVNRVTNKTVTNNKTKDLDKENYHLTLDTVLSYYKEVKVQPRNEKLNEMEFIFKDGMYESIKISYDKKSYLVYDYNIKLNPKAEGKDKHVYTYLINNTYFDKSILSKRLFDISNYVVMKKGEITPSSKYSDYKIIDNVNKKTNTL